MRQLVPLALASVLLLASSPFAQTAPRPGPAADGFPTSPARSALVWGEQQKLVASDTGSQDWYGYSVCVDGDFALVGAPEYSNPVVHPGAAYVLERRAGVWYESRLLTPSDTDGGQYFGYAVSLSGSSALVGAHGGGNFPDLLGSAYVFVYDGTAWAEQAKLEPNDGGMADWFGQTVAIDGDTALVGSPNHGGSLRGAAYVFVRTGTTWTQQAKLLPPDLADYDRFGWSVALSGDTALIGAIGEQGPSIVSGAAYVFVRSGSSWSLQRKLKSSSIHAARFGFAVALEGDTALVTRFDTSTESGAAHVFVRAGTDWNEEAELMPSDPAPLDSCGSSASLSGSTAVIGAYDQDWLEPGPGAFYVFSRSGASWSEVAHLRAGDGQDGDSFGHGVSVDQDTILIGASGSEAAYVFVPQPAASATVRNHGANPASYFVASLPVLGSPFWGWVDLQGTTGHPLAWLAGYSQPLTLVLGGGQVLLVDPASPSGELLELPAQTGASVLFRIAVPNDVALVGLALSTQAVHAGGGAPFALSNAQDLVLGR